MKSPDGAFVRSRSGDDRYNVSVLRLKSVVPLNAAGPPPKHWCSRSTCNPQNEDTLINAGLLAGPPVACNVYLCKYGCVHLCTETDCELAKASFNGTCPLSGFQFGTMVSSYSRNDSRTWYTKPEGSTASATSSSSSPPKAAVVVAKRRKVTKESSEEFVRTVASKIVTLLLFSPSRGHCNAAAMEQNEKAAQSACASYIREQRNRHQLPYLTDIYILTSSYRMRPLPFVIFEHDKGTHDFYVNVILQTWRHVIKFYLPEDNNNNNNSLGVSVPRIDIAKMCLGIMYLMRRGLVMSDTEILPKDEFLLTHLPYGNMLTYFAVDGFRVDKSSVSSGENIVTTSFANALEMGEPPESLQLNIAQLPTRREVADWVDYESERVPVLVTGDGERLFMPTSRKGTKN